MGYIPTTRSGHNMFVMASMLQKAIRRGDVERAGYAAYEMFGSYDSTVWKRLYVVSAEDCWGVLTKEIDALYKKHLVANEGLKGYDKKSGYVSVAVSVLCDALKSRDACYYSCNFIMSDNAGSGTKNFPDEEVTSFVKRLSDEGQIGMIAEIAKPKEYERQAYALYRAIRDCNMEDSGYAIKVLVAQKPELIWPVIIAADEDFTNCHQKVEIQALINADNFVNKKKKAADRDPLFQSKAIMNLMYEICGKYDSVCSASYIGLTGEIDHTTIHGADVRKCELVGGEIPEWVFDVHTIQGKRAGHTDWEMNLVENDALNPMQRAFFEEGSWELRYDYKWRTGICSEKEYLESLEYRKTHESNPAKRLLGLRG